MKNKWTTRLVAFALSMILAFSSTIVYADDMSQTNDQNVIETENQKAPSTDNILEEVPNTETSVQDQKNDTVENPAIKNEIGALNSDASNSTSTEQEILIEEEDLFDPLLASENEAAIWNFFKTKGFSDAGTAGIMGNLKKESGFQPNNLENGANRRSGLTDEEFTARVDNGSISRDTFISSSQFGVYSYTNSTGTYYHYGYGLAQWTFYSRKAKLYDYWKSNFSNVSIGDLNMQLNFIYYEMSASLKNSMTNATDISDATVTFHNVYEGSADSASQIQDRVNYAKDIYDRYHGSEPESPAAAFNASLDVFTIDKGTLSLGGWAYDETDPGKSIQIHVYLKNADSSERIAAIDANGDREDVRAAFGISGNHGFTKSLEITKSGTFNIVVYAVNPDTDMEEIIGEKQNVVIDVSYLSNPVVFNAEFYRAMYKNDPEISPLTNAELLDHWLNYGVDQGRIASPAFDVNYYQESNPNLVTTLGSSKRKAVAHFVKYGMSEKRKASRVFDVTYYMQNGGADLAAAFGSNPVSYYNHYVENYAHENRMCSPDFNTEFYKNNYKDLQSMTQTQLIIHWLRYGMAEGRIASVRFKVIFDANGGTVSLTEKEAVKNAAIGELPVPERSGYSFDGWFTAASGGTKVDSSYAYPGTPSVTLYAHWTKIIVVEPVAITAQPKNVTAGINAKVSFTVTAENAASYQWQYSKNGGAKWVNSSATGCNTASISVTVSTSNEGNIYRCIVTGKDGRQLTSQTAGVDLIPGVVITLNPQSNAVATGEYATFTVQAENAASYQWQYSKDGAHWYSSGAEGKQTSVLKVKGAQNSQGNRYRCVVTGIDGNKKKSLGAAMIVMTKAPATSTAAVGATATFSLKAEGIESYQWQYSKDGGKTWYKSGAAGNTTDTMSFTVTSTNKQNIYRCKLTTADGAYAYTKAVGF